MEFENADDARAAVDELNGSELAGENIIVEYATVKPRRAERGPPPFDRRGAPPPPPQFSSPRESAYRLNVSNLSSSTSWQASHVIGGKSGLKAMGS